MSLRQSSYDIWLNFFNRSANGNDVRISYYIKGPVLGLLFDIQLRELTKGKKSLDDLMRLLYNRYFLKEKRGFTEEEFWASAEEIAGVPLPTLRKYVDTQVEGQFKSGRGSLCRQIDQLCEFGVTPSRRLALDDEEEPAATE